MTPWLMLLGSYIVGAVPFGLLVAKWWAGIDVREHGSRNIGATNVYRVVGKPAGILVFTLDVGKGLWPPLAAHALGLRTEWQLGAGFAAILGHNFSPFLGFRGGKGIATSLGVLLGVVWQVGAAAFALWAVLVGLTGYVSVGSIAAAASLPPFTLLFYPHDTPRLIFAFVAGVFAIFKHLSNIKRLLDGTESNFKKKSGRPGAEG
jgi:glycerol-3-phosphate acyltransferase PlsY